MNFSAWFRDENELLIDGDLREPKFIVAYLREGRIEAIFAANRESQTAKLFDQMQQAGSLTPAGPQGLQNSAQGFTLGNPQNKRFALKLKSERCGYQVKLATYCRAKVRNWDVRQLDHLTPLHPQIPEPPVDR